MMTKKELRAENFAKMLIAWFWLLNGRHYVWKWENRPGSMQLFTRSCILIGVIHES